MDINAVFPAETDQATAELFEQQQREMNKYQTRYVYVPFQDAINPQVPGGYVPSGVIHPVPAPKGKVNVRLLPEGAQVLQVVSPSLGVPGAKRTPHTDPQIEELLKQIEDLKQMALARGQDPPSVAIYLHETAPVVAGITSVYGREGAIEVTSLLGMPANAFESHKINEQFFSFEALDLNEDTPGTAKAVRKQMARVIKQASGQKGQAAAVLANAANEILASVEQCARFCAEHVRARHLEMDDPQNDAPKRYSRRDLCAIDFIGAVKREEYLQHAAEQQQQAMKAIPQMLETMQKREDQMAGLFAEMTKLMTSQTEALKAISGKQKN